MEEMKITIGDWSYKSLNDYSIALKEYCPNGMRYACDGTCLERGGQPIRRCKYFYGNRCNEKNIRRMRIFSENAARRRKLKGEKDE